MQQYKVFIGIQLPPQVKKRLLQKIEQWKNLPVKWVNGESLHVTVSFVGYITDEAIAEVCGKVMAAVEQIPSFDIQFEKISLGPNLDEPNLIWLEGELSDDLKKLEEAVSRALGTFIKERKEFRPHVTLGRLRAEKWAALLEKPIIKEKFSVSVPVDSVDVLESRIEHGKRKYFSLEKCPLT